IARWDGTNWWALGSGIASFAFYGGVFALARLPNGDLVAGGAFSTAGGVSANNIARWDGTSWSALGSGTNDRVLALTTLPNGDLVAGGSFTTAGGVSANYIARWDGTGWSALGSGTSADVNALATLPSGDLVAGGMFATAGGVSAIAIARWNGTTWSPLGWLGANSPVLALTTRPNGDLVAGGRFTTMGGVSTTHIARWNSAGWSPVSWWASGPGMNDWVYALASRANGDLVAGGVFTVVDGAVSVYIAQLTTTCPATAASFGAGCTGSGGPNALTPTSLPWTGSTFRSVATGMPANALALAVLGFSTTSIPLSSIVPQGVPGCSLFVSPDLLDLYIPAGGTVSTQLAIPNTAVLAGQVFHEQVVPVELGVLGITALTSTNALSLTIGSF
ncbi:MAG TPA: hypothetical protein VFD82_22815, partial [Planctomycetota bacterium]|nr:hypothetical protein [Planctomycetota bacterium]